MIDNNINDEIEWAAEDGDLDLVRQLLDQGAIVDGGAAAGTGTALHSAAGEGHTPAQRESFMVDPTKSLN